MPYKSAIGEYRPIGKNIYKKCSNIEGQNHQKCTTKRPPKNKSLTSDVSSPRTSELSPGASVKVPGVLSHQKILELIAKNKSEFGTHDYCEIILKGMDVGSENSTVCIVDPVAPGVVSRCISDQIKHYADICAEQGNGYELMSGRDAHFAGVECAVESILMCLEIETTPRNGGPGI